MSVKARALSGVPERSLGPDFSQQRTRCRTLQFTEERGGSEECVPGNSGISHWLISKPGPALSCDC